MTRTSAGEQHRSGATLQGRETNEGAQSGEGQPKLALHDNTQFIYELALAQMELRSLGVEFAVGDDLRTFLLHDPLPDEAERRLITRSAYLKAVNGRPTDYHFIQRYNRTGSVNQYLTHWIYPYKGKFHPQMIRALLNIIGLEPGQVVLDPFIGSGTAAVEAELLGIDCVGFDISPLCVLQSRVKTESVHGLDEIVALKHSVSPGTAPADLFALKGIADIADERARNFYLLAAMVARSDEARRSKDFHDSFRRNVDKMVASVTDFRAAAQGLHLKLGSVDIRRADARHLPLADGSVDGIITSPPYSIALNYVQNDAHALAALGYDLSRIKEEFVGVRGTGMKRFELYETDMALAVKEMSRVLKPGRFCVIVIGNVTLAGREVDTAGMVIRQCEQAGTSLRETVNKIIFGLYNVMQREFILVFQKPPLTAPAERSSL